MSLAAIVLAAGMSRRMGQPKMLLPWGRTTVLGQVAATLSGGGVGEILVVTGGAREAVEAEVARLAKSLPVREVFNAQHQAGEMMSSIRAGLAGLGPQVAATLVALGDQPQLSLESARRVVSAWEISGSRLILPSFDRRRGHPWLVERDLWSELAAAHTARMFLNAHASEILYVDCDETVLKDLDTPEEYARDLKNRGQRAILNLEARSRFREAAMTDWNLMVERIQNAMQALEKAHEAKDALKSQANGDTLTKFQAEMKALEEHLRLMKQILEHEDTYSMDEIATALGHTLNKERSSYRRIPEFDAKKG